MTDRVFHRNYILVLCYRESEPNRILFILKDRPSWQKGRLNLCGGAVEEGETPEQAAFRELEEETGYTHFGFVHKMGTLFDRHFIIHCLKIPIVDEGPPHPREIETEQPIWINWEDAVDDKRLLPNLKVIVSLMRNNVTGWEIVDNEASSMTDPAHEIQVRIPVAN